MAWGLRDPVKLFEVGAEEARGLSSVKRPLLRILSPPRGKGRATRKWLIFKKGWTPMPGRGRMWCREVQGNGRSVPILLKENIPSFDVGPGGHTLKGPFAWDEMPEVIRVPEDDVPASLILNREPVHFSR